MSDLTWVSAGGELRAETDTHWLRIENWKTSHCLLINHKAQMEYGRYYRDTPEQCKALAARLLEALEDE